MPRNLQTQAQLQAEITKLKQEITQLRTLLKVIWDTSSQAEITGHLGENCATKEGKDE